MRYNNLISPLTTLYENLWHQSMYYVSYMTLYEIQEIFPTSMENQSYTVFSHWTFLYDPCMTYRKSYMVLVWLPRIHTNHIWPSMITKNHIWPSTKSKKVVWSLTREIIYIIFHFKIVFAFFRVSFSKTNKKFTKTALLKIRNGLKFSISNWNVLTKLSHCLRFSVVNNRHAPLTIVTF